MKTVVGVFVSAEQAGRAAAELRRTGTPERNINLLSPAGAVPTTPSEQPGMGQAIGGLVGGAIGTAAGLELGAAAATAMVPGVGPVMAAGLAAAALLGAAGVTGGMAAGKALDESSNEGLPADEVFFYEDALRQGRSVVVVFAASDTEAQIARDVLARNGAETLDAAREAWWIGLRSAEEEHYRKHGRDFRGAESHYRRGFEAALLREFRFREYADAAPSLRERYPEVWDAEAFRLGYERGQIYARERCGRG